VRKQYNFLPGRPAQVIVSSLSDKYFIYPASAELILLVPLVAAAKFLRLSVFVERAKGAGG
jgi:hypothetical protein